MKHSTERRGGIRNWDSVPVEILEDRLSDFVAEFNEHLTTPERRIELHAEIVRLRRSLGKERTQ